MRGWGHDPFDALQSRQGVRPAGVDDLPDEWHAYKAIGREYKSHRRIRHRSKIYVEGDNYTNTIEGFFGLFKNGVRGVYHAISTDYLQSYVDEYAFRYNRRNSDQPMFWAMLNRVRRVAPASS